VRLQILGYKIIVMWECQWVEIKKINPAINTFVKQNEDNFKPLNPHDAFFGGRVEVFKMLVDDKKTKMNYEDVISLYPHVNATCKYPIGHPQFIMKDFGDYDTIADRVFGFIRCKILPPNKLYIPVLPGKYGNDKKLLFSLCKACVEEIPRKSSLCSHTDEERCLTGTWFSEEIKLAIKQGYRIKKIYSAYTFKETSTELFSSYIKKFYKIKLLASGKPHDTETPEKMKKYIEDVKDKEGIDLEGEKFESNPGLRQVSKLMLNSLWGKFGTRRILTAHKFCSSIQDLERIFDDISVKACDVVEVTDKIVIAMYEKKNVDFVNINNVNNIYIAACTTAWARIKLYEHLEKANERAVYCDTDSIIYIDRPLNNLITGEYLGQLKSELPKNYYIIMFCSVAPKIYGYIVGNISANEEYTFPNDSPNEYVKMKGFKISATTNTAFNFKNIKAMIEHEGSSAGLQFIEIKDRKNHDTLIATQRLIANEIHQKTPLKISKNVNEKAISIYNPRAIKINSKWIIKSVPEQKIFTYNYDKRIVIKNSYDTLPFGTKNN
jgi:hypothetical protein